MLDRLLLRPPDVITTDAGTNLSSREFISNCDLLHIRLDTIPIESPQSMSTVERQHATLRRAFDVLDRESPATYEELMHAHLKEQHFDQILQAACKTVNGAIGPDGLVPTVLVYCSMPRVGASLGEATKTNRDRAQAQRKATIDITMLNARRQVRNAQATRNIPNVSKTRNLPIGSLAIVWLLRLKALDSSTSFQSTETRSLCFALPPPDPPILDPPPYGLMCRTNPSPCHSRRNK